MRKQHKRFKECQTCGRPVHGSYICRRCGMELRELLIGGPDLDSQPGIVWYLQRLRETAYGQSKMARSLSARSTNQGYALLTNRRAVELMARISATLAVWDGTVETLRATHGHETALVHMGTADRSVERLEQRRARYIAAHVPLIRKHSPNAHRLHADMLRYAKDAWRVINRPNDFCCGPCPTMLIEHPGINTDRGVVCGTMLYAEEDARMVQCPRCHTMHNVELLREGLKVAAADVLFTGPELLKLMETRLNDRMSKSTFYQLVRDHRLEPRKYRANKGADGKWTETPLYTYDDVLEAREKPAPTRKVMK